MTTTSSRGMQVVAVACILLFLRLHTLEFSILAPLLEDSTQKDTTTQQQFSFNYITFLDVRKSRGKHVKRQLQIFCGNNCTTTTHTSRLSQQVKGYRHVKSPIPLDALQQADAYLYNVRHPIDRILAWYQYEHPSRCNHDSKDTRKACSTWRDIQEHSNGNAAQFFVTCFPTAPLFVLAFTTNNTTSRVSHACTKLAHHVLQNQVTGPGFSQAPFGFPLQQYTRPTIDEYPHKRVLVVRSESIWTDLARIGTKIGWK